MNCCRLTVWMRRACWKDAGPLNTQNPVRSLGSGLVVQRSQNSSTRLVNQSSMDNVGSFLELSQHVCVTKVLIILQVLFLFQTLKFIPEMLFSCKSVVKKQEKYFFKVYKLDCSQYNMYLYYCTSQIFLQANIFEFFA